MSLIEPFIRAYASMLQQPLMLIFTALSVVQIYQGLKRVSILRTRSRDWVASPLEPWKRRIGRDLSFFAAVPIGVLIHELGHAIVVWAYGGRVVEFGYFFFWGFVLPDRSFTPAWREWVLSMSGTIGNLLFALVVAALFWRHVSASVRYAAKRTVSYQIFFALIYYPIFTAILGIGDWRTIYDFAATPMLSGGTAVLHVLILLGFWLADKRDVFDEALAISAEKQTEIDTLNATGTFADRVNAIIMLSNNGSAREAKQAAKALSQEHPHSGDAELLIGLVDGFSLEAPSSNIIRRAKAANDMQIERADFRAYIKHIIGFDHWARGDTERAITFYDEAISSAHVANATTDPVPSVFVMYYLRAIAHAALSHREAASADFEKAISIAKAKNLTQYAARYEEEYQLLDARMRK